MAGIPQEMFLLACTSAPNDSVVAEASVVDVQLEDGSYSVVVPSSWPGAVVPVLLHLHGHNGNVERSLQALDMDQANDMATLLVYPQGQDETWTVMGENLGGSGRDDLAFLTAVMDDVAAKWPVDRARTYVSGFSLGGSMTLTVLCMGLEGWTFAAAAPASGGWWEPMPATCAAPPTPLCRIHGTEDTQWTWEGREVTEEDGGPYQQIGVEEDVAWWREHNQCTSLEPQDPVVAGDLSCSYWSECEATVGLCTYEGGHKPVHEWLLRELEWMKGFSR